MAAESEVERLHSEVVALRAAKELIERDVQRLLGELSVARAHAEGSRGDAMFARNAIQEAVCLLTALTDEPMTTLVRRRIDNDVFEHVLVCDDCDAVLETGELSDHDRDCTYRRAREFVETYK